MRMKPILTEMPRVALTLSSTIKTMRDLMRGILEYACWNCASRSRSAIRSRAR